MYDARTRYVAAAVETASPARLLTMLYDRLLLDVDRARLALEEGRRPDATQHLAHAQEIVAELVSSLDTGEWDGGDRLLSIYTYLLTELIGAAGTGDVARVAGCREIIEPLALTWHEAADSVARAQAPAAPVTPAAPLAQSTGTGLLGVG
ncbi:flagellar export chaperone FliS [Cellulomonas oligotrophica]|uniref:Flagellar protein FliS n=1 Tax=Cellulomonas oligotrophica TaxID=931536 RepID=A0A7Y9JYX1_9CELL|nr:flagellar export chaperone FliS [Cellulomonas oligotrophica]NYD87242.1 flagellar protein FliS [Cellulomonas oligotrophica]GIG34024.1 hypothetical protein Col01nite_31830 [Cellulomonas oligotrophica]